MRSVPCVAGCCGPMLRIMSPVSSSTFTCASARCRNAAGRPRSRAAAGRSVLMRHLPSAPPRRPRRRRRRSPGIGSTSTRPGHGFTIAREQREVLAQRVALELRRQVEVAQARVAVEDDAEHLPASRARASRRRRTPAPTTATSDRRSSTSALRVTPPVARRVDCTRANTWKRPSRAGDAVGRSPCGCTGAEVSPPSSSPTARRRHPVDAGDEREVVAAELRPWQTSAARRHASRRDAHDGVAEASAPCSTTASPSSASRRASSSACGRRARAASARLVAVGLDVASGVVGVGHVSQRRSAPAPRRASARPMSSFWMRSCSSTMPSMNASGRGGQPGT